jgi:acetyl esterase/lipase
MNWRGRLWTLRTELTAALVLAGMNAATAMPAGVRRLGPFRYGALSRQRLDVYAPEHSGPERPLLVFLHGGGWEMGSRDQYRFVGRAFAGLGFTVAVPDYRLTGAAPYPAFLEDCAAAVAWCQDAAPRFGADPARTVLAGHSAGAYNAAMLALDGRWLKGAGARRPIRGWAGLSGPYDFLPLDPGYGQRTFGQVADLPATQPIRYVTGDAPPAFLATGDADVAVRPGNSRRLAQRLREAGVEVCERFYPGVGHVEPVLALAGPLRRRIPVLAEAAAFLNAAAAGQQAPC